MSKSKSNRIRPTGFPKGFDGELAAKFGAIQERDLWRRRLMAYYSGQRKGVSAKAERAIAAVESERYLCQQLGLPWPEGAAGRRIPVEAAARALGDKPAISSALGEIASDGTVSLIRCGYIAVADDKLAEIGRMAAGLRAEAEATRRREDAERLRSEREAAARTELLEAVGGEAGPVPIEVLGGLTDSEALRDAATHPDCGLVVRRIDFDEALKVLVSVRFGGQWPAAVAERFAPGPFTAVPIPVTAKASKLAAYVVADLAGTTAGPAGTLANTISHAEHDRIVVAARDSAWRKTVTAAARKRRGEATAAKRAERAAAEAKRAEREAELARIAKVLGLDRPREDLNTTDAAKALRISTGSVRSAIERGDLSGHQEVGNMGYGQQSFWRVPASEVAALVTSSEVPAWLKRARMAWERSATHLALEESAAAKKAEAERAGWAVPKHYTTAGEEREAAKERWRAVKERKAAEMVAAREAVRPSVAERRIEPETVVFHVGPTNSGKTHDALAALAEAGRGTYAAPLRMLAGEAFEALSERLGESQVGLVTGEERIRDDAPIICCTAEMAPMRGELLVLDEVHWADDPERGWAWTRLLLGAEYRHIHIAGAPDAMPLVRSAFPEAEVVSHERLCPLQIAKKPTPLAEVPERAAVVAFSRKGVYHVAGLLQKAGRRPAVLYGAMPPGVRRAEIARFIAGRADVVVATDVIGHGINLPVSAVLFAETVKYDGTTRRDLSAWEVAQIAGRAGRYGFETRGTAAAMSGVPGMEAAANIVAKAAAPTIDVGDGLLGYRKVAYGRLAPGLDDLAVTEASQLPSRLKAWSEAAVDVAKRVGWIKVASVADLLGRLNVVEGSAGLGVLDVESAWRLARSPLDASEPGDAYLLGRMAHAVAGNASLRSLITGIPYGGSLETLEAAGRQAAGLRWFTLAFPGAGGITHNEVVAYEAAVAKAIVAKLDQAIKAGVAHCSECGQTCAPWSRWCDRCYHAWRSHRGGWRYGDYGDYDGYDWDDDDDDDDDDEEQGYGSPRPAKSEAQRRIDRAANERRKAWDAEIAEVTAKDAALTRPNRVPRRLWLILARRILGEIPSEERPAMATRLAIAHGSLPARERVRVDEAAALELWDRAAATPVGDGEFSQTVVTEPSEPPEAPQRTAQAPPGESGGPADDEDEDWDWDDTPVDSYDHRSPPPVWQDLVGGAGSDRKTPTETAGIGPVFDG